MTRLIVHLLTLRKLPPAPVRAKPFRIMAPTRDDRDTSGPVLRIPRAWVKPRRTPPKQILTPAPSIILATKRTKRLRP